MSRIDPEQERRRLAEFYAGQMDGELEQVAGQAYELTSLAREALRAELARRGLTPAFVEYVPEILKEDSGPKPGDPPPSELPAEDFSPPEGKLELRKMITIRQFRDLPEALLAKGSLESSGIECALADDNLVRLDWFWSNLLGGVKLQVGPTDVETANQILNQPIPDGFDVSGIGEYQQPRCPACQSLDVSYRELNKPVSYLAAYVGVPIPVYRRAWRCHSCQVEWEEDGIPGAAESSV